MNYQKYLTGILYALQVPISVWTGFEFGKGLFVYGIILTVLLMIITVVAVITWMNAQTIEINGTRRKIKKIPGKL